MEESAVYRTPIGSLKLVANQDGVCAVKWLFGKHSDVSEKEARSSSKVDKDSDVTQTKTQEHLSVCRRWLDAYFDGSLLMSETVIPKPSLVLPDKGSFFHSVWEALLTTGVGETLTYKELARLSGHPTAARAVGRAVKSHCIPILVPCHRVVKSAGRRAATKKASGEPVPYEVGQYSGGEGTETKQWLLDHEKKMLTSSIGGK